MPSRKPYNPYTKYGRKKLRAQAAFNYQNATPEGKKELDNIGCIVKLVITVIIILFGVLIFLTKGEDAFFKWLK